jgi:hypothetical protein
MNKKPPSQRLLTSFAVLSCLVSLGSACGGGGEGEGSGGGSASGGASAGSGGGSASGGMSAGSGGASSSQLPADYSLASIEAFLAAGTYKSWVHDAAPRANGSPGSPIHGNSLQVYFNDLAVTAFNDAAAAGSPEVVPSPGAMIVKELYDELTGTRVGTAASITPDTSGKWYYYCTDGDTDLCFSGGAENPVYDGATADSSCNNCHGDEYITLLPQ